MSQKYVFLVSNPLNEAVCLGIIEHLKINHSDCIFILRNNYELISSFDIPSFCTPDVLNECNLDQIRSFGLFKLGHVIREVRNWFKSICDENFHLFVSHLGVKVVRILLKNPNMRDVSVYEEGYGSYKLSNFFIPSKLSLRYCKHFFYPWSQVSHYVMFDNRIKEFYAIRPEAFPSCNSVLVNPKFQRLRRHCLRSPENQKCVIFVLQDLRWQDRTFFAAYIAAMTEYLEFYSGLSVSVYFKLHPEQNSNWEGMFFRNFFVQKGAKEIDFSVCLEAELNDPSLEADVITLNSSVWIYVSNPKVNFRSILTKMNAYVPNIAYAEEREMQLSFPIGNRNTKSV